MNNVTGVLPYSELREKIYRYLLNRKTEVTTNDLASRFGRSASHIRKVLSLMQEEGKVKNMGSRTPRWKIVYENEYLKQKRAEALRSVAVPGEAIKLSDTPTYKRPIQNSYPQIRGYDD